MANIRNRKNEYYSVYCTKAVNDKRLSYRDKGLHAYLNTKPDDWRVIVSSLYRKKDSKKKHDPNDNREGKDAVYKSLRNLAKYGYVRKCAIRDESGQIIEWDYEVYEVPYTTEAQLDTADPEVDKMDNYPDTDLPDTDLPDLANPQLHIRDKKHNINNTNSTNDVVAIVNVSSGDENSQGNNNNKSFDLSFLDRKQLVFKPAVLQVLDDFPEGMWWEATAYTWNGNAPAGFMSSFLELKKKHGWEKYAAGIVIAKGANQSKRPTLRFLETILDKMTINATASPSNVYRMPNASTTSEPVDDDYQFTDEDLRRIEENKQAILAMRAAQ